eukprot:12255393-Heterocapsa_arctica.AAC.1
MWLVAVPLFMVQLSCIFSLRFDLDVIQPVDHFENGRSDTINDLTRTLKLLMVLILQITQFSEMAETVRFFILVLNPISWVEIEHPSVEEWLSPELLEGRWSWLSWCFHPVLLLPWALLALLMRFVVGYL